MVRADAGIADRGRVCAKKVRCRAGVGSGQG